jgi:hypothetical protein
MSRRTLSGPKAFSSNLSRPKEHPDVTMDDLVIQHTVTGVLKLVLIVGASIWLIPRHKPEKGNSVEAKNTATEPKETPVSLVVDVGSSNDMRD